MIAFGSTTVSRALKARRTTITVLAFAASAIATATLLTISWIASAQNANLRVSPEAQAVLPGSQFTVELTENADVTLSSLQTNLTFDPTLVQVVSIAKGTDWDGASIYLNGPGTTRDEKIADANTKGVLPSLALYISPGQPMPAPGAHTAFVITMQAKPGVGGTSQLRLSSLIAVDSSNSSVPISGTSGSVSVTVETPTSAIATDTPSATSTTTGSVTPPADATATDTPTPASTETNTPEATATLPPNTVAGVLAIDPAQLTVDQDTDFQVSVRQNVAALTFGVTTDVTFDQNLLEVTNVTFGSAYDSNPTMGTSGQSKAEALAEANTTGTIKNIAIYQSDGSIAPGSAETLKLWFHAKAGVGGLSSIGLSNTTIAAGTLNVAVTKVGGLVEVTGPATPTPPATNTPTVTFTPVATETPPATSTSEVVLTSTNTVQPASTNTAQPTFTHTAQPTSTSSPAAPNTPSPTPTNSPVPTPPTGALATNTVEALPTNTVTGGTPTGTTTPSATNTPTNTPAAASPTPGTPAATATIDPASADAVLSVSPATITVPPGAELTVSINVNSKVVTGGAQTDLTFNSQLLQLVSVEKASPYAKAASLLAGVAPQTFAQALAEANTTGKLKNLATFFVPGSGSVPAGEQQFVIVKMKAKDGAANGPTPLELGNVVVINAQGDSLKAAAKSGQVTIQTGAPTPVNSVAGTSLTPSGLPNAGAGGFGSLNWALTLSLVALMASGAALVGSLARQEEV